MIVFVGRMCNDNALEIDTNLIDTYYYITLLEITFNESNQIIELFLIHFPISHFHPI